MPVDLSDDFRGLVRHLGGTPAIMRPIPPKSEFSLAARRLWKQLSEFRGWLHALRPDYVDVRRHHATALSDEEREEVDKEAARVLKDVFEQLRRLKEQAAAPESRDLQAHQLGVLLVINDRRDQLDAMFRAMRDFRLRTALAHREMTLYTSTKAVQATAALDAQDDGDDGADGREDDTQRFTPAELAELQQENAQLFNDLTTLVTETRKAEKTVLEIARLETMLDQQVAQQAHEIEVLYEEAVSTTERIKQSNNILRRAKQSSSNFRRYMLAFIILMALALLFLDWYE